MNAQPGNGNAGEPGAAGGQPVGQPIGERPEFDVVFDERLVAPEAKVIPRGDVRIEVWNRGDAPHDFALLRRPANPPVHQPSEQTQRPEETTRQAPLSDQTDDLEAAAAHLAPDQRATLIATLPPGRYVLVDRCCSERRDSRLLELTVQ
jgi:hypothetical protein